MKADSQPIERAGIANRKYSLTSSRCKGKTKNGPLANARDAFGAILPFEFTFSIATAKRPVKLNPVLAG
jgi:hypothetical protein